MLNTSIKRYRQFNWEKKNGKVVYEHRIVMEKIIGRPLRRNELVHHIDECKTNNSPSNLTVVNSRDHIRYHQGWKVVNGRWWKTCKRCNRFLVVSKTNFYQRHGKKRKGLSRFLSHCKNCLKKVAETERRSRNVIPRRWKVPCS